VVDLVDCLQVSQVDPCPWVEGPVCWVLSNPRVFGEPIPYRGAQGLFDVKDEVILHKQNKDGIA
jgi:hypothetical protein